MVTIANSLPKQASVRGAPRTLLAILALALLALIGLFLSAGRWLVVEDALQKADAIAVLSGRMPLRVLEAAKLYHEGYAQEIWLTHSREPGESLKALGVEYAGEETYNRQILLHAGVPAEAIRDLEPPIVNTADEMKTIAAELRKTNRFSAILVTSKVHTRRTRTLWRRLVGRSPQAIIRGVSGDPYEPGHWWRNTQDALDVVREYLGLLNAWAGLPLHPGK